MMNPRFGCTRMAFVLALTGVFVAVTGCQRVSEPAVPPGAYAVKMLVLKGRHGETMALVPVYIHGKGPFAFALDTGASRTVVDRRIAAELQLPAVGHPVEVSGVGGGATAQPVHVDQWRIDNLDVPPSTFEALDLSDSDHQLGLDGLLGSDTLSRFELIHIDYKNERLIFHPGASSRLVAGQ